MASGRRARNTWILAAAGIAALCLSAILVTLGPPGGSLTLTIRFAAMTGYQLVFLSIVSSAYLVELVKFFGRPFIKVHHTLSLTALGLITLHPILAAVESGSASVLLPRFDSLRLFLALGGRAAWYLVALAVVAALLRQRLGGWWRVVHGLNYVAFALATAHANLIGSDFLAAAPRVVSWAMLASIVAVFARKRLRTRPRS